MGSVSLGRHSRGPALALDSIGGLRGRPAANIISAQDEKVQAAAQVFLQAVGEGGCASVARGRSRHLG